MGGAIRSSFPRLGWETSRNSSTKWSKLRRKFPRKVRSPPAHFFDWWHLRGIEHGANQSNHLGPRRPARADPRRVAPKPFQVVMRADLSPHHVHDHVEEIQHHPGRLQRAIHRAWTQGMVLTQLLGDFIDDGA